MLPGFAKRLARATARAFVPTALVAALGLVFVLGVKNQSLKREVRRLRVQDKVPHAGVVVPVFRTVTLTGDSVTIGAGQPGGRQVLFYFTSTCPYCIQTLPAWKRITSEVQTREGDVAAVFGISLDSVDATTRYTAVHALRFPVLRFPDAKTAALYRAVGVPMTVVLDDDGHVLYGRAGALTERVAIDSVLAAVRPTSPQPPTPVPGRVN
jgi:peroxiredoxin